MRILFITHYYEPDSGAAANRLTRLAKQLHARGHQITVLTTMPHYPQGIIPAEYKRRLVITEDRHGIQVVQVWFYTSPNQKVSRRLLSQLSFMVTCTLRGLFVKRPDVILIENQPIFTAVAGWIISHFKRASYLANISDYWPEYLVIAGITTEASLIYRIYKALTNRTQRDAKAIVALYPPLLDKVKERIGDVALSKVIYNAVDLEQFHPQVDDLSFREKHDLGNVKLITFLGILGNHIDLQTMLTVAAHFNDYPNLKFLFVGAGQQKETLQDALRLEEYSHCLWLDWLDYSELPAFWSASYLSYWALDDNPLDQTRIQAKLYEAMASGTPVVVAVKGLMHDIISTSNTGITVGPGDAESMIQAIQRLLDDEDYHQTVSTNARQYAETNYDLQRNVDDYEMLLQKIANSSEEIII